jgi:hypothetical protein
MRSQGRHSETLFSNSTPSFRGEQVSCILDVDSHIARAPVPEAQRYLGAKEKNSIIEKIHYFSEYMEIFSIFAALSK